MAKVIEISAPDLSVLTRSIESNLEHLVAFVEDLPQDIQNQFLSTWALIANNDSESADALRDIAKIMRYYGKSLEIKNLAEIFDYIADSMDFIDESIGIVTESLFGMDEKEVVLKYIAKGGKWEKR